MVSIPLVYDVDPLAVSCLLHWPFMPWLLLMQIQLLFDIIRNLFDVIHTILKLAAVL